MGGRERIVAALGILPGRIQAGLLEGGNHGEAAVKLMSVFVSPVLSIVTAVAARSDGPVKLGLRRAAPARARAGLEGSEPKKYPPRTHSASRKKRRACRRSNTDIRLHSGSGRNSSRLAVSGWHGSAAVRRRKTGRAECRDWTRRLACFTGHGGSFGRQVGLSASSTPPLLSAYLS